jgi:hypothetical protein
MFHSFETVEALEELQLIKRQGDHYAVVPLAPATNVYSKANRSNELAVKYEGSTLVIDTEDLLKLAFNVPISEPLTSENNPLDQPTSRQGVMGVPAAMRRTVGVIVSLDFVYDVTDIDYYGRPRCDLEVHHIDALSEWTEPPVFTTDSTTEEVWESTLHRGVVIKLAAYEVTSSVTFAECWSIFISLSVALPFVTLLFTKIAMYVHPRRVVYRHAVKQNLEYSKEMAKFAANIAMTAHAYKQWDENGGGKGTVSFSEMRNVFRGLHRVDEQTAENLTTLLFAEADVNATGCLDVKELVEIMGDDLCNLKSATRYAARKTAMADSVRQKVAEKASKRRSSQISSSSKFGVFKSGKLVLAKMRPKKMGLRDIKIHRTVAPAKQEQPVDPPPPSRAPLPPLRGI